MPQRSISLSLATLLYPSLRVRVEDLRAQLQHKGRGTEHKNKNERKAYRRKVIRGTAPASPIEGKGEALTATVEEAEVEVEIEAVEKADLEDKAVEAEKEAEDVGAESNRACAEAVLGGGMVDDAAEDIEADKGNNEDTDGEGKKSGEEGAK